MAGAMGHTGMWLVPLSPFEGNKYITIAPRPPERPAAEPGMSDPRARAGAVPWYDARS